MRRLVLIFSTLTLLVACGPGEVGEACQGGAAENDCVDGALCTLVPSDTAEPPDSPSQQYVCRTLCDTNAACEAGFLCQRANGTMLSSCQPDPNAPPPDAEE